MRLKFSSLYRKMASPDISSLRIKYNEKRNVFLESSIPIKEPIQFFRQWFNTACDTQEILEPNAMCLATATKNGIPSSRFVLMKGITDTGITFFTNYGSRKAKEIEENPNVSITFYWLPLRRQVRIEGTATKISKEESELYFHQRPRASQIGAVASPQSQPIPSREYLDNAESKLKEEFGSDSTVPMTNWGGYLVTPRMFEFWQGQTTRLHDRIQFRKLAQNEEIDKSITHYGENGWCYERLAP